MSVPATVAPGDSLSITVGANGALDQGGSGAGSGGGGAGGGGGDRRSTTPPRLWSSRAEAVVQLISGTPVVTPTRTGEGAPRVVVPERRLFS